MIAGAIFYPVKPAGKKGGGFKGPTHQAEAMNIGHPGNIAQGKDIPFQPGPPICQEAVEMAEARIGAGGSLIEPVRIKPAGKIALELAQPFILMGLFKRRGFFF